MRVVVDKAQSRGYANHGWLKTHHTLALLIITIRKGFISGCYVY